MGGELCAPPQRVPEACVIGAKRDGPLDEREALGVASATRDERGAKILERRDETGVQVERLTGERDAARHVAGGVPRARTLEQRRGRVVIARQRRPSMICSASSSVKTRNEFVRTLPWLLTVSETRVIVSSSGASAMTT